MARPKGAVDYARRSKAFEMFCSGVRKADIAKELGVTRPAVQSWSKKDHWEERLFGIVNRAEEALNNTVGNQVAATLERLRTKMGSRITELEALCQPSNHPSVRLQAIKLWLELAGIKRAIPNPTDPTTAKSLELIEDLIHEEGIECKTGSSEESLPSDSSSPD